MPILAAFRSYVTLNRDSGDAEWRGGFDRIKDVWKVAGPSLVAETYQLTQDGIRTPDQVGKNRKHWGTLYMRLQVQLLQEKLQTEPSRLDAENLARITVNRRSEDGVLEAPLFCNFDSSRIHGLVAAFGSLYPNRSALREHLLDAAEGLAGALFVFDEGEADVVVAVVAEADAGADGGFGFDEQELRELERAEVRGTARGSWPRRTWWLSGEATGQPTLVEAVDEDVAAATGSFRRFRRHTPAGRRGRRWRRPGWA